MTRIASLLAIPLAIAFGLTVGAASAGATGKSKHKWQRDTCETRIFQDEDQACFTADGVAALFQRNVADPDPGPDPERFVIPEQDAAFTLNGEPCGCQLLRRLDVICVNPRAALIGSVDRRGSWIRGESLDDDGDQIKFIAKRADLEECEKRK